MGLLIKLKNSDTTLKSLKFGADRPEGGNSGQPFIQTPLENQNVNTNIDGDGIIRGGLTAPIKALKDVERLTKYFFDFKNPNGLLFTAKQNLLSRIAPKTETSFGPAYGGFSKNQVVLGEGNNTIVNNEFVKGNGFINEGIYTPLSTLAQAGIGFTGTHINKQGLDPTGLANDLAINKYLEVTAKNNLEENNGGGPVRSTTPLPLIRRQKRAGRRVDRAIDRKERSENNLAKELDREAARTNAFVTQGGFKTFRVLGAINPLNSLSGLTSSGLTGAQKGERLALNLNQKANQFLDKWDEYRDKRAQRRLNSSERNLNSAQENLEQANRNVEEGTEVEKVYYDNRLLNLWDTKGLNRLNPNTKFFDTLYEYSGGPNSILGIGNTKIRFSTLNDGVTPYRTNNDQTYFGDYNYSLTAPRALSTFNIFGDARNPTSVSVKYQNINPFAKGLFFNSNYLEEYDNKNDIQPWIINYVRGSGFVKHTPTGFSSKFGITFPMALTQGQAEISLQPSNKTGKIKEDFRKTLVRDVSKTFTSFSPDYVKDSFQQRINIGKNNDPGQRGDVRDYVTGKKDINGKVLGAVDTLNTIPVYKSSKGDLSLTNDYEKVEDFCEMKFAILDTVSKTNYKFYMHFRSYLDSFKDNYKAQYKDVKYIGRGEKFHKYSGYDRNISFSFKVVALSKQELLPIYRKLNFLASSLAPTYTRKGYMGGTITEVTVGSYLYNQPGIITSMAVTVPKEATWELQILSNKDMATQGGIIKDNEASEISDFRDPTTQVMPHMVEVSIGFTPIHNFRVQSQTGDSSDIMTLNELLKNINNNGVVNDKNAYGIERYINLVNRISDGYLNNELPEDDAVIKSTTNLDNNQIQRFGIDTEPVVEMPKNFMQQPNPPEVDDVLGDQTGEITGLGGGYGVGNFNGGLF